MSTTTTITATITKPAAITKGMLQEVDEISSYDFDKVVNGVADTLEEVTKWAGVTYYRYLLVTAAYGLEFWERSLFNGVVFGSVAAGAYLTYGLF